MTDHMEPQMLVDAAFLSHAFLRAPQRLVPNRICGHQNALGEYYISTGSLYLCSTGLLALGLLQTLSGLPTTNPGRP